MEQIINPAEGIIRKSLFYMVGPEGLEPSTRGL